MPYFIETWDKPGHGDLRLQTRPVHLDYLERNKHLLLACGAKLTDDGAGATGGVYIIAVETPEEAGKFIADDPFTQAGLFERIAISRWRKAYFDGRSHL
jgi:hypothetical protein